MMPESAMITEACAECQEDLEHCHGTAILHVDGAADCSDDPDCRLTGRAAPVRDRLRRGGVFLRRRR